MEYAYINLDALFGIFYMVAAPLFAALIITKAAILYPAILQTLTLGIPMIVCASLCFVLYAPQEAKQYVANTLSSRYSFEVAKERSRMAYLDMEARKPKYLKQEEHCDTKQENKTIL
ncbi:hypothetical protein [Pseudomonas sp. HY7a-MNA-CIBAN-0227]|uniref:hypothetical protein n=1 Tax=Pseudomonas sp. HY7a-MNA-CIBAN-0227 TaxID=3140474 RepID=UPI003332F6B5